MANPTKLTVRALVPNGARAWPTPDVIDTTGTVSVLATDTGYHPDHVALVLTARGAVSARVAPGVLPPSVRSGLGDLTVPQPSARAASAIINPTGANNDVLYTANAVGSLGNDISICYIDPDAASRALTVDVRGKAIRVSLATDASKAITSTAAQVIAAVNAHWMAGFLVTAENAPGSTGAAAVTAVSETHLAGGADMDGVHAAVTIAPEGNNNDVDWTAVVGGAEGNDITIEYDDPGAASQALTVTVVDKAITISLATDGAGAITSTANDVIAKVAETAAAKALVTGAPHGTDTGAGVVTAMAPAALTGGADLTIVCGPFEGARFAQDNGDLDINFEIINGEMDVIAFMLPG